MRQVHPFVRVMQTLGLIGLLIIVAMLCRICTSERWTDNCVYLYETYGTVSDTCRERIYGEGGYLDRKLREQMREQGLSEPTPQNIPVPTPRSYRNGFDPSRIHTRDAIGHRLDCSELSRQSTTPRTQYETWRLADNEISGAASCAVSNRKSSFP